jgi:uncharacterized membrane protein YhfC
MLIISSLFTFIAAFLLPVAAAVWMSAKERRHLKPVLLGVLTFVFFQGIRLTLNELVLKPMPSMTLLSVTQPVVYYLFFGATAALFEEGGRWIVMSLFMKDRSRFNDGIAFGIGHGGIEAIIFAGLSALIVLFTNDPRVSAGNMFTGGVERIFAMTAQIAFSVMVLKGVRLKKPLWLLLAFVLHTVLDAGLVISVYGASAFLIEAYAGVFALVMLGFLIVQHKKSKGDDMQ